TQRVALLFWFDFANGRRRWTGLAYVLCGPHFHGARFRPRHHGTAVVEFTKDHLARRSLQYRGHRNIHGLADHLARIVHHDHGAVIQIGHTLVVLFAFLQDEDLHD